MELKINGGPVIAFAPFNVDGQERCMVVVDFGKEAVVAHVNTLDDAEWYWGHYHSGRTDALQDFARRLAADYGAGPLANPEVQVVTDTWNANLKL